MTKEFQASQFDPEQCHKEALELQAFLAANPTLAEREEILPFFKARVQLSAFVGSYHPENVRRDLVAHELPLFGDFTADLVVGDSKNSAFTFVEFEDACPDSIFKKKKAKATPNWSPRFEAGFSQIVDWFFKLHDQGSTVEFENKFGSRTIKHLGVLVVGRTQALGKREEQRLCWRQEYVLVNSKQVHRVTFDKLCADILDRLEQFLISAQAEEKQAAGKGRPRAGRPGKKPPRRKRPGK